MEVGDWRQGFGSPLIRIAPDQPTPDACCLRRLDRMESFHPFNHEEPKELIILKSVQITFVIFLQASIGQVAASPTLTGCLGDSVLSVFWVVGWELVLIPGIVRTRAI